MELHKLKSLWDDPEKRSQTVLDGLRYMLESTFTVITPKFFDERDFFEWSLIKNKVIEGMVEVVANKMYGRETPVIPQRIREIIMKFKWEETVCKLGKEILEKLGFLWYGRRKVENEEQGKLIELIGGFSEDEIQKFENVLEEMEVDYVVFPF